MYNFTISMALMDFVPVIFFGITAVLLLGDLYNKMGKGAYVTFAAGSVNVFLAGFCKALWKLLYAADICDFVALEEMFMPVNSLGLLFVGVHTLTGKQKYGSYMIVVRYDSESDVESKLSGISGYKMKNKTIAGNYTELVCEVKLTDVALKKIDFLRNIPGVREVTIMRSVSGSVL